MTRDELKSVYDEGDGFNLFNVVSEQVRPEPVRHWFAYGDVYRDGYREGWAAVVGEPFEEDSLIDGLAYAAFAEGWSVALMRVGGLLGINPETFKDAVAIAEERGVDTFSPDDLAELRAIAPFEKNAQDIDRYFNQLEAFLSRANVGPVV